VTLFEPIFAALERAGVRYVTVGGVAVVLHGHARLTADLDLAVDLAPWAASEAIDALTAIGFRPLLPVEASGFADPAVRERWIAQQGMTVFSMWDPDDPLRSVDLFRRASDRLRGPVGAIAGRRHRRHTGAGRIDHGSDPPQAPRRQAGGRGGRRSRRSRG